MTNLGIAILLLFLMGQTCLVLGTLSKCEEPLNTGLKDGIFLIVMSLTSLVCLVLILMQQFSNVK